MSDTSYAVLARAKAKFGKRLRPQDYKNMLECENVADIMTYLKSNTRYKEAFGEANERGIRRGLFENLLKQYLNNELDTLSRYELSVGEDISNYLAHNTEIDEIIRFLTLLNSKSLRGEEPFNFTVPPHIAKKTSIKLNELAKASNYDEFLQALSKTEYGEILKKYDIKNGEAIPIPEIENELYIHLYSELYETLTHADSTEFAELEELFNSVMDYENFIRIVRLKKYYNASYDRIKSLLLPFGTLSEKNFDEMINAQELSQVFDIMRKSRYGKLLDKIKYKHISELALKIRYKNAKHNMYYSQSPTTVMISYIILCKIELHNLTTIIECVRYNIDREKVEPLILY